MVTSNLSFKQGDWVQFGEHFAYIHTINHKSFKFLIEWNTGEYWVRDWVTRSILNPLDPAINDLLRSIYNHH